LLVGELVDVSVQQDLPAPQRARPCGRPVAADRGGAVVGQRVVPNRVLSQTVHVSQVVDEERLRVGGGVAEAIQVDLFAAEVRAQPDDIALVGHDVGDLVLPEESAYGGVVLSLLLARLDGDRDVASVGEPEAEDRVGDRGRPPVHEEDVQRVEIGEAHRTVVVPNRVVGLGPVLVVAHVVQHDPIAVDLRPRQGRDVGLPVAVVRRRNEQEPDDHEGNHGGEHHAGAPPGPDGHDDREQTDRDDRRDDAPDEVGRLQVGIVDGECRPQRRGEYQNARRRREDRAAQHGHSGRSGAAARLPAKPPRPPDTAPTARTSRTGGIVPAPMSWSSSAMGKVTT